MPNSFRERVRRPQGDHQLGNNDNETIIPQVKAFGE
jgi:hypothetical protein